MPERSMPAAREPAMAPKQLICIAGPRPLHHALNEAPGMQPQSDVWHGTTILTVRKGGIVAIGGDGQVTIGQTIVKANAKKVRRLGQGEGLRGFSGGRAAAL